MSRRYSHQEKYSKIERQFYSKKNYNLLKEVLLDSINSIPRSNVDKKNLQEDIFNTMLNVCNNITIPEIKSKTERKKFLNGLNKEVLSILANKIKNNKPIRNNIKSLKPVPIERFGNERITGHMFNKNQKQTEITNLPFNQPNFTQQNFNQPKFNNLPIDNSQDKIKSFYSREPIQPIENPLLHPNKQITNLPKPINNLSLKNEINLKDRFKEMEEERNSNGIKRPNPIDFSLPKNSIPLNNINPENKLNELLKIRNNLDSKIESEKNTNLNQKNTNLNKKNTNLNKNQIQTINNSLNSKADTNANIENTDTKSVFKPFTENNFLSNNFSQNMVSINNLKNNLGTFMDGLDNKLLEVNEVIDKPDIKSNKKINIKKTLNLNEPKILKTKYLTIHSLKRNSNIYSSSLSFAINFLNKNEKYEKYEKYENEIIFEKKILNNNKPNINEIISIECLDVVLPSNNTILQEPFLWLCIKDWGLSNIGTYVPDNAFARLKIVNEKNNFITLRPHILERQTPIKFPDNLSIDIKDSTGNKIDIYDRKEIKNIIKNTFSITEKNNIEKGDKIYIYSLYPDEITGFYPNVFMYDLKINKKNTMTFRLFIDKNNNNSNRVSKYIKNEDKKQLFVFKYLNNNDLFFIEYIKNKKISKKYKIIEIKNDLITIEFPQQRKYIPKKITRIGFVKMNDSGYTSNNNNDINFKGGHTVIDIKIIKYT